MIEAVCVLLGEKPDWDTGKRVLGGGLLDRLRGYDKDRIPPAVLRRLRKYIKNEDMGMEAVARVSFAASLKRGDAGYNGVPAVVVSVQKQPAADTAQLTGSIEAALEELKQGLPAG